MKKPALFTVLILLGVPAWADSLGSEARPYAAMAPVEQYRIRDRQEEIALARTAAPPSISADAEVLVLGPKGYEVAVQGKNGFVCFVERSWTAGFDNPEFWNPKLRAPNCFNPPAALSVLPQYLERTEWALAGDGLAQIVQKTKAAFASGHFSPPAAGSFSFMLSKQSYVNDVTGGPWLPHVMLFVPHGQAAAWAAGLESSPILGSDSSEIEPTVLFIPVRRWSDGTPGPAPAVVQKQSP
jgi:hypothetical protein